MLETKQDDQERTRLLQGFDVPFARHGKTFPDLTLPVRPWKPGDEMGNYPVIFRSAHDNQVHVDPKIQREIEI
eukprot:9909296-Karenia_brevis.AAC.1